MIEDADWKAAVNIPVPNDVAGFEVPEEPEVVVAPEYIAEWAPVEDGSRAYVESHLTRLEKTLAITPPGGAEVGRLKWERTCKSLRR